MFDFLKNFLISKAASYVAIGLVVVLIITAGIAYYYKCAYDEKCEELIVSNTLRQQEKLLFENEIDKAKVIINNQNSKIDEYKINIETYTKLVNEKEKALIEARVEQQQELDKELSKDSSADNQLKIINKIMKEFSNGL